MPSKDFRSIFRKTSSEKKVWNRASDCYNLPLLDDLILKCTLFDANESLCARLSLKIGNKYMQTNG